MAQHGSGSPGRIDGLTNPGARDDPPGIGEIKAVRLSRPFWRDNPARYFLVAEMTFALHRITSDESKNRDYISLHYESFWEELWELDGELRRLQYVEGTRAVLEVAALEDRTTQTNEVIRGTVDMATQISEDGPVGLVIKGTQTEPDPSATAPRELDVERGANPTVGIVQGCWNCGGPHRYGRCPEPWRHSFCYGCGSWDLTLRECPRCGPEYRVVERDYISLHYESFWEELWELDGELRRLQYVEGTRAVLEVAALEDRTTQTNEVIRGTVDMATQISEDGPVGLVIKGTQTEPDPSATAPRELDVERGANPTVGIVQGCWNCGGPHRYGRCPEPWRHSFCYGCGSWDLTLRECPQCGPEYRVVERYIGFRGPRDPHRRPTSRERARVPTDRAADRGRPY
ncbi:hypothetical protein DMN91_008621 [Ooceraea biroi]|uniref:Uncharacterized protein n=1 Tax=Ooceraea biroi TaxID=2015173 RepID=A0A3L8DCR0_OOCBI|nr:hypothetical protein DMN91_008621 [Ooceraea biroi]